MDHLVVVSPQDDWAPKYSYSAHTHGRTDRDPLENFLFDRTTIIWPALTGAGIVYCYVETRLS